MIRLTIKTALQEKNYMDAFNEWMRQQIDETFFNDGRVKENDRTRRK